MVAFSELGVREAVERIRTGDLRAEALAEALLVRCAAASPLNAFISLEPDRVRAAARRADKHRQRGERRGRPERTRSRLGSIELTCQQRG
jgi:mandelamide amidase